MKANTITFGIELEVFIPTGLQITVGQRHNGAYIDGFPRGWNAQADGSLGYMSGFRAVEVVSPKLKGEDGLTQIIAVVDYLAGEGAVVNDQCGLHIHVDGRKLTVLHIERLIEDFRTFEKVFFALNGDKALRRYGNPYCKNSQMWFGNMANDRYRSLNLRNWYHNRNKKTVEFRLFAGTLEAETVVTAVYMCVALVAKAASTDRTPNTVAQTTMQLVETFVQNVLAVRDFQIIPDFEDDSLFKQLYDKASKSNL